MQSAALGALLSLPPHQLVYVPRCYSSLLLLACLSHLTFTFSMCFLISLRRKTLSQLIFNLFLYSKFFLISYILCFLFSNSSHMQLVIFKHSLFILVCQYSLSPHFLQHIQLKKSPRSLKACSVFHYYCILP
jgi:hypothetical protein